MKEQREKAEGRPRRFLDGPGHALIGEVLPKSRDYELNEDGCALCFADLHAQDLRFCHGPNRWHRWDDTRWKVEGTRLAFSWCRDLARHMARSADTEQLRATLGKASFAGGVERFAQADRVFAVTPDLWDRDPWLLGTPGGTVDLRTGTLHPPSRDDFITKQTSVTPAEPGTPHPIWDRFLDEVTCGDRDLRRFIMQIFGYCLTGIVSEECMFFLHGVGQNGKGTVLRTMTSILGDYAVAADMATFTAGKYDRHPAEIAKLAGARMVTASETERGRTWAWSRIKELTGNETKISARFMRRDFFEFLTTFKLVISGNHKPHLPATDEATARRVNLLPFGFIARSPDRTLKDRLIGEYPAILRSAIDGCLDWQRNGLLRPEVVVRATQTYLDEQDLFTQWVDAECTTRLSDHDTHAALFASWVAFCEANGEVPGSARDFAERMAEAGFKATKHTPGHHGRRGYLGIALVRPQPADWTDR